MVNIKWTVVITNEGNFNVYQEGEGGADKFIDVPGLGRLRELNTDAVYVMDDEQQLAKFFKEKLVETVLPKENLG